MPDRLKKREKRVVGVRQVLRAIRDGSAETAFLAMDADAHLRSQIEEAAKEHSVPLQMISTMEELSQLCRVDVPSAAAAAVKSVHGA